MRSAEPSIECALRRLKEWGAEKLILLPLFPHYSTTTSGTCFHEAIDALKRLNWNPPFREIFNWPDHYGYTGLLRRTVDEVVAEAESELAEKYRVMGRGSYLGDAARGRVDGNLFLVFWLGNIVGSRDNDGRFFKEKLDALPGELVKEVQRRNSRYIVWLAEHLLG